MNTTTSTATTTSQDTATLATLRALADPHRLQLLALIRGSGGEACVCDLTASIGLAQATVSHHLRTLVDAGLLNREKRGSWAWYRVVPDQMAELSRALLDLARPTTTSRSGMC